MQKTHNANASLQLKLAMTFAKLPMARLLIRNTGLQNHPTLSDTKRH